jgi:hypothetical protein
MRNRFTVRSSIVAFLLLVSVTAVGGATDSQGDDSLRSGEPILGSWVETTTIPGGPSFSGLVTFDGAGTLVSSYQGNVNTAGPLATAFTAGHGRWVREGARSYSTTAIQLVSDLAGNLLFVNKLRQRITLNRSKDRYRSEVRAEFHDPAGTLLFVSEGTTEGMRVPIEPLP